MTLAGDYLNEMYKKLEFIPVKQNRYGYSVLDEVNIIIDLILELVFMSERLRNDKVNEKVHKFLSSILSDLVNIEVKLYKVG